MMTLAVAGVPALAASGLSSSVAVAIGALVVVLAIVLVFFMVLRSNGGPRKTASGIGYDAQRGPLGQPGSDGTPWRQGQQTGWQPDEYAGPQGPNAGGWGQTQDYPGAPAAQGQPGPWGPPQGSAQGGWDEPAPVQGGGWGTGGGDAGDAWPPRQPGGWGGPQQQGQPGRGMSGANGWDAPAQAPAGGGWDAPAQGPAAGGGWGAPAGGPAAMPWEQPEQSAPAWSAAPASRPEAPREWSQPGGAAAGARAGWGADAAPAANSGPGAAAAAWGAPGASGPQGGFGAGDLEKTRIANPAAARTANMIVVKQGKEPGRMFDMRKDRMTIGRSRESDIFLEDLAVSRLHTTISRDPQGQYIIRDENSANGTYVNNQKVTEQILNEGDEIQVGQTVLSFVRR